VVLSGTTRHGIEPDRRNARQITCASITYGGTLSWANLAGTLAAGNSFKLFNATSLQRFFCQRHTGTPGAGLAWDLSQLNSGFVNVVAAGGTGPVINNPQIGGGSLILSGSGGTNNGPYHVLTTTNLATPLLSLGCVDQRHVLMPAAISHPPMRWEPRSNSSISLNNRDGFELGFDSRVAGGEQTSGGLLKSDSANSSEH